MKTLIIFYSLEGNTKFLAESISSTIGADTFEIKTTKEMGTGFMKYFWGGKQVMMKEKPEILSFDKNLADYEMILIGSPVWASTFAPALYTFLNNNKIAGKKVALFCSYGGSVGRTLDNLKVVLKDNEIVGEIGFKNPLKDKEASAKKIQEWIKDIMAKQI